jgi:hypothetical protein
MRILFYGGCHASALRRIFEEFGKDVEEVAHLTNFRLIRDRIAVPYEDFTKFDWVIFNPILNKEAYNTSHLEDFLKTHGVKFLKYPWLQWEGYFPKFEKAIFPWYTGWWPANLDALPGAGDDFDRFREAVFAGDALIEQAQEHLEMTNRFLRRLEANVDLPVSDYVLANYRQRRLFRTPDHPATPLYQHLVRMIESATGCRVDESFYETAQEVQQGLQLPILPYVARALGLEFRSGDFEAVSLTGSGTIPLGEWLKMHFYKGDLTFATARAGTRLMRDGKAISASVGTRLLLRRLHGGDRPPYRRFEILGVIAGAPGVQKLRGKAVEIYPSHWTVTQRLRPSAEDEATSIAQYKAVAAITEAPPPA